MARGTSGGNAGTSGGDPRRKLALAMAAGFALVVLLIAIADIGSMQTNLADAGRTVPTSHIWILEWSSIAMLIALTPAVWWMARRARPPALRWPVTIAAHLAASLAFSINHVAGMIAIRELAYLALGENYSFGDWQTRFLYEYRKDAATYAQFTALALIAQWALARAAPLSRAPDVPILAVRDGTTMHLVPAGEIDHVAAAGNYVEISWRGRTLLHRATLAAVAAELGPAFVQIHRGRLVRRAAVHRIDSDRTGDFMVTIENCMTLRGSRRFRANLRAEDGGGASA